MRCFYIIISILELKNNIFHRNMKESKILNFNTNIL